MENEVSVLKSMDFNKAPMVINVNWQTKILILNGLYLIVSANCVIQPSSFSIVKVKEGDKQTSFETAEKLFFSNWKESSKVWELFRVELGTGKMWQTHLLRSNFLNFLTQPTVYKLDSKTLATHSIPSRLVWTEIQCKL